LGIRDTLRVWKWEILEPEPKRSKKAWGWERKTAVVSLNSFWSSTYHFLHDYDLNFISKEVIVGIFSQLPTTSLQWEWEVCPKGGSWELIKPSFVAWFKMEDACIFLRVLKSLKQRKVTNIESGGPLGPFILHVTLAHSW
jgi:hypothetical protein